MLSNLVSFLLGGFFFALVGVGVVLAIDRGMSSGWPPGRFILIGSAIYLALSLFTVHFLAAVAVGNLWEYPGA